MKCNEREREGGWGDRQLHNIQTIQNQFSEPFIITYNFNCGKCKRMILNSAQLRPHSLAKVSLASNYTNIAIVQCQKLEQFISTHTQVKHHLILSLSWRCFILSEFSCNHHAMHVYAAHYVWIYKCAL